MLALNDYVVKVDEEIFGIVQEQEKIKGEAVVEQDRVGRLNMQEMNSLGTKKKELESSVVEMRKRIEKAAKKHEVDKER